MSPRRSNLLLRHARRATLGLTVALALALASTAFGAEGGVGAPPGDGSGGSCSGPDHGTIAAGKAVAPCGAPVAVKMAIAAGNEIRKKHYRLGGGHKYPWVKDRYYDCSGTVSWLLHGGSKGEAAGYKGLIKRPMTSGELASNWKSESGRGDWITVMANGGHTYIVVAGLRMDTSGTGGNGPRWTTKDIFTKTNGPYSIRHPKGL
ncbi:MAG: hypothetical protein QOJ38_1080 [Solirubrobacterales bacterium]|nr:hypothetical protein [Solirubrobacterales bacterium]